MLSGWLHAIPLISRPATETHKCARAKTFLFIFSILYFFAKNINEEEEEEDL